MWQIWKSQQRMWISIQWDSGAKSIHVLLKLIHPKRKRKAKTNGKSRKLFWSETKVQQHVFIKRGCLIHSTWPVEIATLQAVWLLPALIRSFCPKKRKKRKWKASVGGQIQNITLNGGGGFFVPDYGAITTCAITTYIYTRLTMPSRKLRPGRPRTEDMMSWFECWHKNSMSSWL